MVLVKDVVAVCAAGACFLNGYGGATFRTNTTTAGVVSRVTVMATSGSLQHSTTKSVTAKVDILQRMRPADALKIRLSVLCCVLQVQDSAIDEAG